MCSNSFGECQIKQSNKCINEITVEIYNKNSNYGGAVSINNEDIPNFNNKLELYFTDYQGFDNFYQAIIKMKQGIDEYLNRNVNEE